MENKIEYIRNGIHNDLSIEDYHANISHISSTTLKFARKSLKAYQWYRAGKIPKPKAEHFDMGNAFEIALIDRHQWKDRVAILDDDMFVAEALAEATKQGKELTRPKNSAIYQKRVKEFKAQNQGKNIINNVDGSASYTSIEEMLSSCYQDRVIQALIENVESNLSCFWTDPDTKLNLKCRPDITQRKKNLIINIKTTKDGSPAGFSKDLVNFAYPFQAAVEIRGVIATGVMETVDMYLWVVVEKNPPYCATVYEFADDDRRAESDRLDYVLSRIQKAEAANKFPGYSDGADNEHGILTAVIPPWY